MPTDQPQPSARLNGFMIFAWFVLTLAAIVFPPLFLVHLTVLVALPFRRRNQRAYEAQKREDEAVYARQRRGY